MRNPNLNDFQSNLDLGQEPKYEAILHHTKNYFMSQLLIFFTILHKFVNFL